MGKKYFDTKDSTLESSILSVWAEAAKKNEDKLDPVNKNAVKKKFDDRKDKDIDNDGDVDSSDKFLHKRRKAVSKSIANEGLEDSPNPANSQHLCAKNVVHEEWGAGQPVHGMHDTPDADGNIAWYDVMFEHGIEKGVSINELKVTKSESHHHGEKKKDDEDKEMLKAKKEEVDLDEAVDKNAADELKMYIENDAQLYKSQLIPIVKNMQRKMKSGKYDHRKAPKLWMYLVDAGAKKYVKEFGGDVRNMFDKQTRQYVAQQMADEYKDEIEAQGGTMFEEVGMDEAYSPKQIKMAIGIANDPRYKGGNMTGAVKAIEKIRDGLSNYPEVEAALRKANENLDEGLGVAKDIPAMEVGTDRYREYAVGLTPGENAEFAAAKDFKVASMKEALAKVWGLDEKALDKSSKEGYDEEDEELKPVKGSKTMTGGKIAKVDTKPKLD